MASPSVATEAGIARRLSSPIGLVAMVWFGSCVAVLAEYPFGGFARNREELWAFWIAYAAAAAAISYLYSLFSGFALNEAGWNLKFQHRASVRPFLLVVPLCMAVTFILLVSHLISFPRNYHPSLLGEACICTICPVVEELLFRGWFQTALTRIRPKAGEWVIASTSAGVFALAHFLRVLHGEALGSIAIVVVGTFLLGLIVGRVRQTTGNLMAPIALHVVYNVTGVLLMHWLWTISRTAGS